MVLTLHYSVKNKLYIAYKCVRFQILQGHIYIRCRSIMWSIIVMLSPS